MTPGSRTTPTPWLTQNLESAFSQHVRKFNAREGSPGRLESFELHHRAGNPFHKSMILLDNVVQIFALENGDVGLMAFEVGIVISESADVAATFVDAHFKVVHDAGKPYGKRHWRLFYLVYR